MTTFPEAYAAFARSNRDNRADLWTLCECTYVASQMSTIVNLANSIGLPDRADSIGDWCKVGWLIEYCAGVTYQNEQGFSQYLSEMWHDADALSYDHLLRAAKLAKRHEISPLEILERLYNAACGGQDAEPMARDIEEAHEDETVIGRRDLRTIRRRLQQNFGSVQFRKFISDRTARLAELLDKSVELDLKRLEAE